MKEYGEYFLTETDAGWSWVGRWYKGDEVVAEQTGSAKTAEGCDKAAAAFLAKKGGN
jgi:hypothetical protein